MAKTQPAEASGHKDEHQLAADFRQAIENKDLVTMGQMLELLGTLRAELQMGKPVIDKLAAAKKSNGSGGASAQATKAVKVSPKGSLMARLQR